MIYIEILKGGLGNNPRRSSKKRQRKFFNGKKNQQNYS